MKKKITVCLLQKQNYKNCISQHSVGFILPSLELDEVSLNQTSKDPTEVSKAVAAALRLVTKAVAAALT